MPKVDCYQFEWLGPDNGGGRGSCISAGLHLFEARLRSVCVHDEGFVMIVEVLESEDGWLNQGIKREKSLMYCQW